MPSFIYSTLKPVVKMALKIAYRKIDDNRLNEVIPKDGPVIIVSNHQNALIDPLLVCSYSTRQISFLTRASAFKNPLVAALLKQFNMLPIFRPRDSVDIKTANESVFEESINRLCKGEIIGIFPEGSHAGRRKLRPLRKGFARMARMALEKDCDPFILPVGLDFSSQYDLNSRAILLPGKGFYSSEIGGLDMDEKQFYIAMVAEASKRMIDVSLEIEDEASDKIIWRLDQISWNDNRLLTIDGRQALADRLDSKSDAQKSEIRHKLKAFQKNLIKADRLAINLGTPSPSLLKKIIVGIGSLCSFPLRKLADNYVEKLIEDPQFIATMRFAIFFLAVPSYLTILLIIFALIWGFLISVSAVALISLFMLARWSIIKSQAALSSVEDKKREELVKEQQELNDLLV